MSLYQLRIVPTEHDPRVLPFAQVSLVCSFTVGKVACEARFVLPSPTVYAAVELPPISKIAAYAALEGWTRHPDTGGHLCPDHPYGTPVAEIESHEAAQVSTDTAEIDVDAVKAALEEGEDDE